MEDEWNSKTKAELCDGDCDSSWGDEEDGWGFCDFCKDEFNHGDVVYRSAYDEPICETCFSKNWKGEAAGAAE